MAYVAFERISGRLCCKYHERIALSVGFQAILCKTSEGFIAQRLPEFINANNHPFAGQGQVDPVKQIQHDRRADIGIVEKIGHVEAEELGVQRH